VVRALVVDENVSLREEVVNILSAAGHGIVEASSGKEGLKLFLHHAPDVVITTVVMPDKDGLEIIAELRRLAFDGPIIAISNGAAIRRAFNLRLARMMGADEALAEPFSALELIEAVERVRNRCKRL
jgi:CheY-like chemotaxis protein